MPVDEPFERPIPSPPSTPSPNLSNLSDWILLPPTQPCQDVLGHPATRAMLTHGGVHSCYEAAFHGVPIVAAPFMAEAADMASKLIARGGGVMCRQAPVFRRAKPDMTFSAGQVAELLHEVHALHPVVLLMLLLYGRNVVVIIAQTTCTHPQTCMCTTHQYTCRTGAGATALCTSYRSRVNGTAHVC